VFELFRIFTDWIRLHGIWIHWSLGQ